MDYQYGGSQQAPEKKESNPQKTTVVLEEDEQLAQQSTQGNQAVNHVLRSGNGAPPPAGVSPNPWSSNLFSTDFSNAQWNHTSGTEYDLDGDISSKNKTKQKTTTLYEVPENSIIPNEDIKHVHKNRTKEYTGMNVDLTTTKTDAKETEIQQGDTSLKRSNVTNFITDNTLAHVKDEGISGGAGLAIKNKDSITSERSENGIDYRNKQVLKKGIEGDWSRSKKKSDGGVEIDLGGSTMASTRQEMPENEHGTQQILTKTTTDKADLEGSIRRRTDLAQEEGEENKSNHYGGIKLDGSHSKKVALSTVYQDGSKYTHDREGSVFGEVGAKETSTGRNSQSASVGVGGEMGWEFQNTTSDNVDQKTRVFAQGDMSAGVEHSGDSLMDGWEFSTENSAAVGVNHDRNWLEGSNVERDQSHKVIVGSELDHNWTTDETEAKGKGQYIFNDSTTTQVDSNKTVTDSVSHDVSGQVGAEWENNLFEKTDWEGKALYAASFKKSEAEQKGNEKHTSTQGHKFSTNSTVSDDSFSGGLGYENSRENAIEKEDGQIHSNAVIDKVGLKASRDINVDEDNNKKADNVLGASLGRTYRTKDIIQTQDGKVTRQNDKAYTGDVGYNTSSKNFDIGASRSNFTQTTNADGSKTKDKVTDKLAIDSKGSVGLSRNTSSIANSKTEKIAEGTKLTTDRGKVDTSVGVTTGKDEDGIREYGANGKVSYTHFSQKLTHKATPMVDKITGLKMGDKDTDVI